MSLYTIDTVDTVDTVDNEVVKLSSHRNIEHILIGV